MKNIRVKAPARINLIGEHIDYHGGFVLPAAINLYAEVSISLNQSPFQVNLIAEDFNDHHSFDLRSYNPSTKGWTNYMMGVFSELQKLGAQLEGCDVSISSTIPMGAGLSSSAALECGLAVGLNQLFNIGLSKVELVKSAQLAEHNFVGTQCGIMDQFASMMGKENHALFLDCSSLDYRLVPINLGSYQILLLNSNVSHQLSDSAYNDRQRTSKEGLDILKSLNNSISTFRDVSISELKTGRDHLSEIQYRRCHHVIAEMKRVLTAVRAIESNDMVMLGQSLYHSHESLKTDYDVTCRETDFLVDYTCDLDYILGARQMGGGFGGCTINLIHRDAVSSFLPEISNAYKDQFDKDLTSYNVDLVDGASVVAETA